MSDDSYDLLSIFFLALSAFVCIISLMIMSNIVNAGPFTPETPTETPLPVTLPTSTATPTVPTNTPPPPTATATSTGTFTPFPSITATITGTPTITFTPTTTLSQTPVGRVPSTPLPTPTPIPTETATPTEIPPEFPLVVQPGTPLFRDAYLYDDCEQWQGIAGQVTLFDGVPAQGLIVRVTGPGIPGTGESVAGSSPDYASSGWEVQVATGLVAFTYEVQVFDETGTTELSDAVVIEFTGECLQNLAQVNFVQVDDF